MNQEYKLHELAEDVQKAYLEYKTACEGEDDQAYETAQTFLTEFVGMYFDQAYLEKTGEKFIQPDEDNSIRDQFHNYIRDETDFARFDDLTVEQIKQSLDEHIQLVFDDQQETLNA